MKADMTAEETSREKCDYCGISPLPLARKRKATTKTGATVCLCTSGGPGCDCHSKWLKREEAKGIMIEILNSLKEHCEFGLCEKDVEIISYFPQVQRVAAMILKKIKDNFASLKAKIGSIIEGLIAKLNRLAQLTRTSIEPAFSC